VVEGSDVPVSAWDVGCAPRASLIMYPTYNPTLLVLEAVCFMLGAVCFMLEAVCFIREASKGVFEDHEPDVSNPEAQGMRSHFQKRHCCIVS